MDFCPNDSDNDIDGDGICGDIDQHPDCYDNFYDCFGICGGDAIIDECDQCVGGTTNESTIINLSTGKGHSVLTLDFVDQAGHPTREALDNLVQYLGSHLNPSI